MRNSNHPEAGSTVDRERFSGFADLYAGVRPQPPQKVVTIALGLLNRPRLGRVVDLGSGTGLSTAIWADAADSVVGIEPTADMRNQARKDFPDLEFLEGTSYAIPLASHSVDVVACSQAFHWMEPTATLAEVDRILKNDGLFLVYDCQWPVTWSWPAEQAYEALVHRAKQVASDAPTLAESSRQFPKEKHRENLRLSGVFAHCGTVLFDHTEPCDGERFLGIALSQGLVQGILKKDANQLKIEIEALKAACSPSTAREMRVSYVLHYGIKAPQPKEFP